ncbi:MAG: helicase C-terminal domain-containing protein [Candidatus Edwardsbacteria bacterium]|nr:helicase C-terminal domain-containing protein [Candidatus Edwardsbacteria bacterium]
MPKKKKEQIAILPEAREERQPLAFVAVDTETTGLDADSDEIIEIGAAKYENGAVAARYQTLVRAAKPIQPFVQQLTGITQRDMETAPAMDAIAEEFTQFLGGRPLVFHNAGFDRTFLASHLKITNPCWDSLTLARALLPSLKGHSLRNLCRHFGIDPGRPHRAEDDAIATALVFAKLYDAMAALDPPVIGQMSHVAADDYKTLFDNALAVSHTRPRIAPAPETMLKPTVQRVDDLAAVFGAGKALSKAMTAGFEDRAEQRQMAEAVLDAFDDQHYLCVEAGTGTGKSLAYLAPAVIWSRANKERVIVSTHTKTLQEQLYNKDVPLLRSAVGDFKAAVLKGRNNYLCRRRWLETATHPELFLSAPERDEALILTPWSETTETGDIAEHRGFSVARAGSLWSKVCSDHTACQANRCREAARCFLQSARKRAEEADVVIVNHSLLFSDLIAPNRIIPEYRRLIVDEAHNIERVATDFLGYSMDRWTALKFLATLYARHPVESGLIPAVNKWLRRAGLNKAAAGSIERSSVSIAQQIFEAGKQAEHFFNRKWDLADKKGRMEKRRYLEGDGFQQQVMEASSALIDSFEQISKSLSLLYEWLGDVETSDPDERDNLRQELYSRSFEGRGLSQTLGRLVSADQEGYVFWMEPIERSQSIKLVAGPLEVGKVLHLKLYAKVKTGIFTSATLAVDGKFDFLKNRIGLSLLDKDLVETSALSSPFDFVNQAAILVPQYLPSPKERAFDQGFSEMLAKVLTRHKVGTLVLFTAFDQLFRSYFKIKELGSVNVAAQGLDGHPAQLVERSLAEPGMVIFGTSSFWEGVDLPGAACELLIMARLPFSVPSDPLVSARCQAIEDAGGSSFHQYLLPEAVIRFRQGFGRLIRSKMDKGLVIVGDSRIISQNYGQVFLRSLPKIPVVVCRDAEELKNNLMT